MMQNGVVQKTHSGRNLITSRTVQSAMQWWFPPVFDFSLRLRHQTARQRPCGMCTYTAATSAGFLVKKITGFVDRAQVPGRDYMAQPGSPCMRRRCHPTLSLRPTQAKSGINAQEEARGSRSRESAIGSTRATIARPKRLARQACKQQPGLSSLVCGALRASNWCAANVSNAEWTFADAKRNVACVRAVSGMSIRLSM